MFRVWGGGGGVPSPKLQAGAGGLGLGLGQGLGGGEGGEGGAEGGGGGLWVRAFKAFGSVYSPLFSSLSLLLSLVSRSPKEVMSGLPFCQSPELKWGCGGFGGVGSRLQGSM